MHGIGRPNKHMYKVLCKLNLLKATGACVQASDRQPDGTAKQHARTQRSPCMALMVNLAGGCKLHRLSGKATSCYSCAHI